MSATQRLADLIEISPRFRRSVNVKSDLGDDSLARGYVVSSLAAETIERILDALSQDHGARNWTILGPYGTGKSSVVAFLASLLDCRNAPGAASEVLEKSHPALAAKVTAFRRRSNRGLLPVIVVGRRTSLARAILESLAEGAEQHWSARRGRKPGFIARSRALLASQGRAKVDDAEVAALVLEAAIAVQKSAGQGGGILLVIDELGKLLEHAAEQPDRSDIFLLQLLSEHAARVDEGTFAILGVLHQAFEAYARLLPQTAKIEWAKVGARFETIPFLEPANHLLRLTAEAIRWKAEVPARVRRQVQQAIALMPNAAQGSKDIYLDAAPLHPVTARLLGPLLRQIGQNERSLFSFLMSQEPFGFAQWLNSTGLDAAHVLYPPHQVYDYVRGAGLAAPSGSGSRAWVAAEEALARLPKSAGQITATVLKTIAVLTAAGPSVGLPVSAETLKAAHSDEDPARVEECLASLCKASAVVFRSFNNSYQLWDGSDIDIDASIHDHAERLTAQGGLAARLQRLAAPRPVMAPRHYHRTGTFRYFVTQYLDIEAVTLPQLADLPADGVIYLLLPDQRGELPSEAVARLRDLAAAELRPTVLAVPGQARRLRQTAVDLLSVQDAMEQTAGLESDPVARRELKARHEFALERFIESRDQAWSGATSESKATWHFRKTVHDVNGRATRIASDLFDALYSSAPILKNELVNRRELSTAAAAARRELLGRMISSRREPRLGIEGHPAELSIYLSVLEASGLHRKHGSHEPDFAAPSAKSTLDRVWREIDSVVRSAAGDRLPVTKLYDRLSEPPFGVRTGVAPILTLCYYLANEATTCLYEEGSFVPAASPDLVHRLLRRPDTFEIQFAAIDVVLTRIGRAIVQNWDAVAARGGAIPLLAVVRAVVRMVRDLSPYAAQTTRISAEARRLRSAVLGARDPVKLLTLYIPEVFGIVLEPGGKNEKRRVEELAVCFARAREELTTCDDTLLSEIGNTLVRLLGGQQLSMEFLGELQMRARRLTDKLELVPAVKRFVQETAGAAAGASAPREWAAAVATLVAGKPPTQWTDDDAQRFPAAAMQICRGFLGAEQLVLELKTTQHDAMRLVRVSVLDSQGGERSGIAVLRPQSIEKVSDFLHSVRELALKHEMLEGDVTYAVIAALLDPGQAEIKDRQVS